MSLDSVRERYLSALPIIGKHTLAALYPNDFEAYITALELVDSADRIVEYFVFPLNPVAISKSEEQIVNIRKTAGGISKTSTETYMPSTISLKGNFGRKFKILVGQNILDFEAFHFSETFRKNQEANIFSNTIKTGFGCIKILERIIRKSNSLDKFGNPYFLHLYNLNFGDSYLVSPIGSPTFDSSMETNMIFNYNVTFKTLADLKDLENANEFSNMKLLGFAEIQKELNRTISGTSATVNEKNIKTVNNFMVKNTNKAIKGIADFAGIGNYH